MTVYYEKAFSHWRNREGYSREAYLQWLNHYSSFLLMLNAFIISDRELTEQKASLPQPAVREADCGVRGCWHSLRRKMETCWEKEQAKREAEKHERPVSSWAAGKWETEHWRDMTCVRHCLRLFSKYPILYVLSLWPAVLIFSNHSAAAVSLWCSNLSDFHTVTGCRLYDPRGRACLKLTLGYSLFHSLQ